MFLEVNDQIIADFIQASEISESGLISNTFLANNSSVIQNGKDYLKEKIADGILQISFGVIPPALNNQSVYYLKCSSLASLPPMSVRRSFLLMAS